VAFSLARDGEISPHLLLKEAQRRGKYCYLPVMSRHGEDKLTFRRVEPGKKLHSANRYAIPEPRSGKIGSANALSLVLLPLVAFDAHGNRLGMGKGYYDRTFAFLHRSTRRRPLLMGLAHECQRAEQLEVASWDVPLHAIVTDEAWYQAKS
jgi:5-formyltetrahydrofolate cyclo-ligase